MSFAALTWLALLAGPAVAQDRPAPPSAPATSADAQLSEALSRIEALEERLAETELALQAQGHLKGAPLASATSVSGGLVVPEHQVVAEAVSLWGPVEVHGRVRGPVVAFGGDVLVHEGAQVDGDAVAFGGRVRLHPGGRIDGSQLALWAPTSRSLLQSLASPAGQGRDLARRLVLLLAFAGTGVLVVGLFPVQVDRIARGLEERPLRAALSGAVVTLVGFSMVVTLTLTVLGIPLALMILGLLGLAWVLGFIGLCQTAGDILPLRGVGARRWTAFLMGVVALAFAGLLPPVGRLILLSLGLLGAGAAVRTRLGTRELA